MQLFKSDYLANKILDHVLGTAEFTFPSTVYIALYTSDPTAGDVGVEVSGGNYARISCDFDAAASRLAANTAAAEFAEATDSWGTITHYGIRDADTDGNLLYFGPVCIAVSFGSSDTQYDITNPEGIVIRYTYDGTGTDPAITSTNPTPGDVINIDAQNFNSANKGAFVVINSDTNYFEVINTDGVAEDNKTVGTGTIKGYKEFSRAIVAGDQPRIKIGELIIRE